MCEMEDSGVMIQPDLSPGHAQQQQIVPSDTPILDTSHIQPMPLDQQAEELQSLDLSVYEQETLERGFLEQLEEQTGTNEDETEQEKQIRMGEMTPFGTTLSANNSKASDSASGSALTDFERYLMSQAELANSRKRAGKKKAADVKKSKGEKTPENKHEIKQKSPLKMSVLHPKKQPKRVPTGTWTSDNTLDRRRPGKVAGELASINLDSGSEYVPSDESEDDDDTKRKKKRKRPVKKSDAGNSDEWATDDSDWESSEDESKPRRRRSKLELDDGNISDYRARIKEWSSESEYEVLEGGLQVPMRLWAQMYK